MAPPAGSLWWSFGIRSVLCCCPGTVILMRSPTGAPPRCIPTITWPASTPSIRCQRPSVRPGQKVEIRLDSKLVRLYHRGKLVKVHERQPRGGRATDPNDYPAELTAYTMKAPERIKRSAALQGPAVAEYAERLFEGPLPWSKIRQGHQLLRLGERYTPQRLDAACQRALAVDLVDVRRLERIPWCRPWKKRPCRSYPYQCQPAVSPGPAPSLPMPPEINHDPCNRTHSAAQEPQTGRLVRHAARAHRPGTP